MGSENNIIISVDLKKEKRKAYDKDRIRPAYYEEKRVEIFCIWAEYTQTGKYW